MRLKKRVMAALAIGVMLVGCSTTAGPGAGNSEQPALAANGGDGAGEGTGAAGDETDGGTDAASDGPGTGTASSESGSGAGTDGPSSSNTPSGTPTEEPTPTGPAPTVVNGITVMPEFVDRWVAGGAEAGPWGAPAAESACYESGASCWQRFDNGTMRWREDVGVIDCAVLSCVALTFDDGPAPDTGRLLDSLVERNVQATFFVVGNRLGTYAADLQRQSDLGMQIGNHSWDHPNLSKISADAVAVQLTDTNNRIAETIGYAPTMLRPPYGAHSASVDAAAGAAGLAVINWSAGPADWEPQSVQSLIDRTLNSSTRGSIILLHDIHSATVDAVPGIVDGLMSAGYTVVTVDDLLGPVPPGEFHAMAP